MDRRLFLTGLLGLAGTAVATTIIRPESAQAGILNPGNGILYELDASAPDPMPDLMDVDHRPGHHRPPGHRRPRRHRRRVWRRVCRRVRVHGRWQRRCWRERVWIWV